ncbi:MAG: hypothetical protein CMH62_02055 [Nanoarchaeota archaeon]|nr:hypothetical protein [Nanoarchaeota archaeon]
MFIFSLKKQIIYWVPVYLYMGIIFYFSSQSSISLGGQPIGGPNIIAPLRHSAEYFILALLVFRGSITSKFRKNSVLITILISGLYGFSDEVHQYFVPGRTFSFGDILFDLLGIIIGVLIYKFFKK